MKSFTVLASAVLLALSLPTTYASPAEIRSSSGHQCTTYSRLLREENCAAVLRNGGGERKQRCLNIKDKRKGQSANLLHRTSVAKTAKRVGLDIKKQAVISV
ncbi:hypothetical protein CISG_00865 [Coccidioides immitis RMSCC 3703]|uniref:Uncharacterized protein n=1 Tax=Coccidioides immitis RMSCC 3703 TaxID=454286 RepID=A0A0J8QQY3_COCIT|nr:hypothetical protein CISG_00865 [Coccidioides immitis RMSCC 3703]